MLKDYFNSNLSPENQCRIAEFLLAFPIWRIYTSYGQARSYRATQDFKDDNGRYHFSIVLYDGYYYIMDSDQFHRFKALLHSVELDDVRDKRLAMVNAVLASDFANGAKNNNKE